MDGTYESLYGKIHQIDNVMQVPLFNTPERRIHTSGHMNASAPAKVLSSTGTLLVALLLLPGVQPGTEARRAAGGELASTSIKSLITPLEAMYLPVLNQLDSSTTRS